MGRYVAQLITALSGVNQVTMQSGLEISSPTLFSGRRLDDIGRKDSQLGKGSCLVIRPSGETCNHQLLSHRLSYREIVSPSLSGLRLGDNGQLKDSNWGRGSCIATSP